MLRRSKSNNQEPSSEAPPKRRRLRVASIAACAGAVVGVFRRIRARAGSSAPTLDVPSTGQADWPPLKLTNSNAEPSAAAVGLAAGVGLADAPPAPVKPDPTPATGATTLPPWVEPEEGQCPLTHPVKGNASSNIYHVPDSRFYAMTLAERCYRDAEAAEADGMRAPKR